MQVLRWFLEVGADENTHTQQTRCNFVFLIKTIFFITHLRGMRLQNLVWDLLNPHYRRRPSRIMTTFQEGDRSGSSCGLPAPLCWSVMRLFSGNKTRYFSSVAIWNTVRDPRQFGNRKNTKSAALWLHYTAIQSWARMPAVRGYQERMWSWLACEQTPFTNHWILSSLASPQTFFQAVVLFQTFSTPIEATL